MNFSRYDICSFLKSISQYPFCFRVTFTRGGFEFHQESLPVRIIEIDYRGSVLAEKFSEQSFLSPEIIFHGFVEIQMVSREIRENSDFERSSVYPMLFKGMGRDF